ncbi:MAG: hypothetical protein F4X02_10760 [Chloroflexi bacterium]|nr:hypothetical protein [Chloroflexota bacterium]
MQTMCQRQNLALLLILALFSLAAAAAQVSASSCSLADHIRSANTNTSIGGCPKGTSHDIIALTEDVTLSESLPPITGTITIEGNGHTISGDNQFRLFDVSGGRLTLSNLTLAEGYLNGNGGAIRLRNDGALLVVNSTFKDNWAYRGGAIAMVSGDVAAAITGSSFVGNQSELEGGVFLLHGGTLTITNSSFVDNDADRAWGGVFHAQGSRLTVTNSTFKGNEGLAGGVLAILSGRASFTHVTMVENKSDYLGGDALFRNGGAITLRNSLVSNRGPIADCDRGLNVAEGNLSADGTCSQLPIRDLKLGPLTGAPAYFPLRDGSPALDAAVADYCPATDQIGTARPQGGGCDVGAIESTTARLAPTPVVPPPPCPLFDQIVAANTDAPSGGCDAGAGHDIIELTEDIALDALLPRITSEITIEGNGHTISGEARFRIFNVDGGALTINNLTLAKGRVAANAKGGALVVQNGGRAIINNASFKFNVAKEGGAIWLATPGTSVTVNSSSFIGNRAVNLGAGGAIDLNGGRLVVNRSSFVDNRAESIGGAIATWSTGEVVVTNSTFRRNQADKGGAIFSGGAPITLTHVTMANNFATDGVALHSDESNPGRISLRNSIVYSTSPRQSAHCAGKPLAQNVGNLSSDDSCGVAAGADPLLGELTGEPAWQPLMLGSPAIDAADARFCPETDQIGTARPQDGGCDIGAVEWNAEGPAQPEGDSTELRLKDCSVTTTHALNFRDGPAGAIMGLVAEGATLGASAHTAGWFQVEYRGETGWISADYVKTDGECG